MLWMLIKSGLHRVLPSLIAMAMVLLVIASSVTPYVSCTASSTGGPEVVVEVFPDSSVALIIQGFEPLNTSNRGSGISGIFTGNITQLKKGMDLIVNTSLLLGSSNTSGRGGVELGFKVSGNASSTTAVQKSWANLNASLNIRNDGQTLRLRVWSNGPLKSVFNRSGLYADVRGNLTAVISGNNTVGMLLALSLLNKGLIEKQLTKANATYIHIKELETRVSGSTVAILFDVGINYSEMIDEIAGEEVKANVSPESVRELVESGFTPHNTTYSFEVQVVDGVLRLNTHIHSTLSVGEALHILLKTFSNYSELLTGMVGAPERSNHTELPKGMIGVLSDLSALVRGLDEAVSKFEILPSSTYVLINASDKGVAYRIQTFKIRYKGAKTPEDTLKALTAIFRNLAEELNQTKMRSKAGREVRASVERAFTAEVSVKGVEGVQVTPSKVRFIDLDKVNVTLPQRETAGNANALKPSTTVDAVAIAGIAIAAAIAGVIAYLIKK